MNATAEPIAEKAVNALIVDAKVSLGARLLGGGIAERTGKRMFGGLWVGGAARLYADRLEFEPNALNRAAHAGECSRSVPLAAIRRVDVRNGAITKIIDLVTEDGVFSIRCYGARDFAHAIRVATGLS